MKGLIVMLVSLHAGSSTVDHIASRAQQGANDLSRKPIVTRDGRFGFRGPRPEIYCSSRSPLRLFKSCVALNLPAPAPQVPVKFDMAVNVKTAKALALTVPPSILLRADEVVE